MFDQYKVNGLKYEFIPRFNSIDQSAAYGTDLYTVIDRNDNDAPTSLNQMLQYQSLKKSPITRRHVRYFRPCVLDAVYRAPEDPPGPVVPLSSQPKYSPWLSCDAYDSGADPAGIQHLGIKFWANSTGASSNTTMDVICTAYIACKDVK